MNKKEIIKICYIDDDFDVQLSKYLVENYIVDKKDNIEIDYSEYKFNTEDNYKKLLKKDIVKQANIILIDSRLFENMSNKKTKFTGEKFKIILRQIYPFIKTVVISQNETTEESSVVSKFKQAESKGISFVEHYDDNLKKILDENIKFILEERKTLEELNDDEFIDELLLETIDKTFNGLESYSEFEKKELDNLIEVFEEVRSHYDNQK
ncbi:hypothetical protein [Haliovirga abyssi]|uniref:Response regulator n=1 Tax=Haliovirga abyssi TaxID=2996794 RepID=A0AAU9DFQ5_9FUSO|nr:hypothetical protein [Haliovirga abyssi]BDU49484.1 hypothetical protein HLVA_00530 [Haliovirga abyssi]